MRKPRSDPGAVNEFVNRTQQDRARREKRDRPEEMPAQHSPRSARRTEITRDGGDGRCTAHNPAAIGLEFRQLRVRLCSPRAGPTSALGRAGLQG